MKIIGILLILVGVVAIFSSTIGFGDIGLAFFLLASFLFFLVLALCLYPKDAKSRGL